MNEEFDGVQCLLFFWSPRESDFLAGESAEWSCQVREVRQELCIVVDLAEDAAHVSFGCGRPQILDDFDFSGVHFDAIAGYDMTQIIHFLGEKGAL